jgi:hypothetical protein
MTSIRPDLLHRVHGGRDCSSEIREYLAARRAQMTATEAEGADQLKNPLDRSKWDPLLHEREEAAYTAAGEAWTKKDACLKEP